MPVNPFEDPDLTLPGFELSQLPTYFAPAARKNGPELERDIQRVSASPIVDGLMMLAGGLLAILNQQRQVVALNQAFLTKMGVSDPGEVLGLRQGEMLKCIHAGEMEGGCGTSRSCGSCGAALAIVAALTSEEPQEKRCALTVASDRGTTDFYFDVRSHPLRIEESLYLMIFLQDVTVEQQRACLDRTFFHDINNMLCGLIGKSYKLSDEEAPSRERIQDLQRLVVRIAQEIAIHNSLQNSMNPSYKPLYSDAQVNELLKEMDQLFRDHRLTITKQVQVSYLEEDRTFVTDLHLASRIVTNMVTNALEAVPDGSTVKLDAEVNAEAVTFRVWNEGEIPEEIKPRIFQLNYSTKSTSGRGFGTFSMKLFGEQILGGSVQFHSTAAAGTIFTFTLPLR